MIKFSIITPTFKRTELLKRAVASVIQQTYTNWEMIIVNDSPYEETYRQFASSINDSRIRYFVNEHNRGVNYSRNSALDNLSADSTWVIFLDDDDYFAPDTLTNFSEQITINHNQKWFVTNRALKNGTSLTRFPHDDSLYSYAWQYLILKRCKGDATHCIETKLITYNQIRFSKYVKQGEEWFFFYQLGLHSAMLYSDHNSTISDGYDARTGLNFRKRTFQEKSESLLQLLYEAGTKKIIKFSFVIYSFLRILKLITFR